MNTWKKYLLVTLAVGLPATALSLPLWPPQPGADPSPLQVALFFGVFAAEGLLFGFGVAFVAFGGPLVRSATRAAGVGSWPVFASLAWTLLSWWPHDGFHRASPLGDVNATLRIDYAFHITLVVAAVVIARFFLASMRTAAAAPTALPVTGVATDPAPRERAAAEPEAPRAYGWSVDEVLVRP